MNYLVYLIGVVCSVAVGFSMNSVEMAFLAFHAACIVGSIAELLYRRELRRKHWSIRKWK